jgi:hypothetical protein
MIFCRNICHVIFSAASVDASRSWLGGGVLKPLEPSPCAADAMIAAKGNP